MKSKIFFFCSLLSFSFISLSAQKGFEFGGAFQYQSTWMINQTDFDKGPELDVKPTYGIAYGANLSFGFSARHGIRTGLFISQQGQKYTTDDRFTAFPQQNFETQITYQQIPFLYRYTSNLTKQNTAFMLYAGPQFGLLQTAQSSHVVASTDTVNQFVTYAISPLTDSKSTFNDMDISALMGLGIISRFGKHIHMNATLNFSFSLSDIEASATKQANRSSTNNGVIGLQVGLYYLFKETPVVHKAKMRD
jgi:hypothetical protein